MKKLSQKQRILNHLKKGKSLTPIEALRRFGCFRLASRVSDLRDDGYNVQTAMIKNNGKRYASYFLDN